MKNLLDDEVPAPAQSCFSEEREAGELDGHIHPDVDVSVITAIKIFLGSKLQWNPFIAATLGEQNFSRYIGVAFIEGLFCTQTVHLGPGCLAVI